MNTPWQSGSVGLGARKASGGPTARLILGILAGAVILVLGGIAHNVGELSDRFESFDSFRGWYWSSVRGVQS